MMRLLPFAIVALLSLGIAQMASVAIAQTPADPPAICNTWRTQWNDVSAGAAAAPMRTFLARVPTTCRQLRGQIERFIAQRFPAPQATIEPERRPNPGPQRFRDCADCPEMVVVPAGSYVMGTAPNEPGHEADEAPQRRITFARPFAVGRYEITRAQYAAFVRASAHPTGENCYVTRAANLRYTQDGNWRDPVFTQGEDHPVVCVSWSDAQAYVRWLNTQTSGGYRLLSEAEWEYAARVGGRVPNNSAAAAQLCAIANHSDASATRPDRSMACRDGHAYTSPVGAFPPNAFGLYDLDGNVKEWTADCYDRTLDYVPSDGSAYDPATCQFRTGRGGNFHAASWRLTDRGNWLIDNRFNSFGFRVAKTLS